MCFWSLLKQIIKNNNGSTTTREDQRTMGKWLTRYLIQTLGYFLKTVYPGAVDEKKSNGKNKTYKFWNFRIPWKSYTILTCLQNQPILTKITAIDLTSKEAKNHGVCRVKYQNEAESTLQGRKVSLNAIFSHSHSLQCNERKAHT